MTLFVGYADVPRILPMFQVRMLLEMEQPKAHVLRVKYVAVMVNAKTKVSIY